MNYSQNENHATADVDNWYFDGQRPQLPQSDMIPATDQRVILGCAFVGMIGIVILLAVLAGSTPDVDTVSKLIS